MKKIYLSGKISGLTRSDVEYKFNTAEKELQLKGWAVVNPSKLVDEGATWSDAMRVCITAMMDCDAIYLLYDWDRSKGAKVEYDLAVVLKMEVIYAIPNLKKQTMYGK